MHLITSKFKRLRKGIKTWARNIIHMKEAIKATNEIISCLDSIEEIRDLYNAEWNGRIILKEHLMNLLKLQHIY